MHSEPIEMQKGKEPNKEELLAEANDMLLHGSSLEKILEKLQTLSTNEETISEVVILLKQEIHKKDLKHGRLLILSGCIVMVVGFVLTCIKFHSNESINMVMFGFTTLGICILFVGLSKIF